MTVGVATATANAYLNVFRATTYTGVNTFLKLHIGDPGAAGANNASVVTTRNAVTFAAPSGGSMGLSALASYTMTATETISHWSLWDASTVGNFLESGTLTSSVPVINGSILSITALTLNFTPLAA